VTASKCVCVCRYIDGVPILHVLVVVTVTLLTMTTVTTTTQQQQQQHYYNIKDALRTPLALQLPAAAAQQTTTAQGVCVCVSAIIEAASFDGGRLKLAFITLTSNDSKIHSFIHSFIGSNIVPKTTTTATTAAAGAAASL